MHENIHTHHTKFEINSVLHLCYVAFVSSKTLFMLVFVRRRYQKYASGIKQRTKQRKTTILLSKDIATFKLSRYILLCALTFYFVGDTASYFNSNKVTNPHVYSEICAVTDWESNSTCFQNSVGMGFSMHMRFHKQNTFDYKLSI